jgi:hypothetical protein
MMEREKSQNKDNIVCDTLNLIDIIEIAWGNTRNGGGGIWIMLTNFQIFSFFLKTNKEISFLLKNLTEVKAPKMKLNHK